MQTGKGAEKFSQQKKLPKFKHRPDKLNQHKRGHHEHNTNKKDTIY